MELKTYLNAFGKFKIFIISITATGTLLAFVVASGSKGGYSLNQTFFISPNKVDQQESQGLNPDYFAQEKARNFTDTAISILDSEDFRSQISSSGQTFSVRKLAPQIVRVTAVAQDSQGASRLMAEIPNQFNSKIASLDQNSPVIIKEISPAKSPTFIKADRKIYVAAGTVLGLALAFFTVSLKIYFRL